MAVPFTILSGFLGSGKTTLLNRALANAGGRKIAVLVNELGRIAIDSQLIVRQGSDILELAGGCVCCSIDVKNDLWDGIAEVIKRSKPDAVILETTGIAEPQVILEGLHRKKMVAHGRSGKGAQGNKEDAPIQVSVRGVVTAVDCYAGVQQIHSREEAREQVLCADGLVLTKLDISEGDKVDALHEELAKLNPEAQRVSFPDSAEGGAALVNWALSLERRERGKSVAAHVHKHGHQLSAASFRDPVPLTRQALMNYVNSILPTLVRVKGWVHLAGEEQRGYLELAGGRLELRLGEAWADDERMSEFVMIGTGIDEAKLRMGIWACRAAQEPA